MEATNLSRTVRVSIDTGKTTAVFICKPPSGEQLSKFLGARFRTKRNKVINNLYPARVAFFDEIVIDCEGVTFDNAAGEQVALNRQTTLTDEDKRVWSETLDAPVRSWKDLIPVNWKSGVAIQFEKSEAEPDEAEDEDDSEGN